MEIFMALVFPLLFIFIVLIASLRVLNEYERGVFLFLGRFSKVRGPGLTFVIPLLEKMYRVDMRTVTMDIPSQDIITSDNVTLKVDGVVYFSINDPAKAMLNVENFYMATAQIAQTTLRSVIGQFELDHILSQRDEINHRLQEIIDEQTNPWGIKVTIVELKGIDLPLEMQRAMAKQAEAERNKRAKVISAEGEVLAANKLVEAAKLLEASSNAILLRYLDTMKEVGGGEGKSTTLFPYPAKLFDLIK